MTEETTNKRVGINQVLKALGLDKEQKATIKAQLESLGDEFKKGMEKARTYDFHKVVEVLRFKEEEKLELLKVLKTRSATAIKRDLEKARKAKDDLVKKIKELENELLGK